MPLILPGNVGSATAATGYDVANSCRFNDDDSAYMHKTPGSASNRKTFTISAWVKRSDIASSDIIFGAGSNPEFIVGWQNTNTDQIGILTGDGNILLTNRLYRDISAWYHIVVAVDTTQATDTNRCKLYVNGVQETSFASTSYPSQDADLEVNNTVAHEIGRFPRITSGYYNGYLSEFVLIDGSALAADQFGEFDSDSGIWKPIDVSGLTFGTNGFYLDFEDSANLGNDANGGTDLTEVNLAATDQSTDTCTNNFNTPNPLYGMQAIRVPVFAEGNLKITGDGDAQHHQTMGTFAVNKGKWFWEAKFTVSADIGKNKIGIMSTELGSPQTAEIVDQSGSCVYVNEDGGDFRRDNATVDQNAGVCSLNQIISVALNMDDGEISIYRAGSLIVDALDIGNAAGTYVTPASVHYRDAGMEFNFGSPPYSESGGNSDGNGYGNYSMSVPSGYYSWNTKNLSEFG